MSHPDPALPWAAARRTARRCPAPLPARVVPLAAAAGAVLAEDILARTDLPPDIRRTGEIGLETGEIGLEAGEIGLEAGEIGLEAGEIVLEAGEIVLEAGEIVLEAGTRLGPAALGLLAAAGQDVVPVRRATVAVLALGDELLTSGPARDGRLRDALGPLLGAWLPALGLSVVSITRMPNRRAALAAALSACPADVVVTTRSTARGSVDHLHDALDDAAARLLVDGVAVRPGHPMLLALLTDGRPLIGLPGNPLAAVSALLTLLHPVLDTLHGCPEPAPRRAVLAEDVSAGDGATRLIPTRLIPTLDGRPVLSAGPAMLRDLATADAVAVIPPGGLRAGAPVELLPLP